MAISCEPSDLAVLAECTPCVTATDDALIYLLCAWANGGAAPEEQGFLENSQGGFILLSDGGKIIVQT